MKKDNYKFKGEALRKSIEFLNAHPEVKVEYKRLAKNAEISESTASNILCPLVHYGYLLPTFRGKELVSQSKANEITLLLYDHLFLPIKRAMANLDSYAPGFRDKSEYYSNHPDIWKKHIKNQILIYERERTMRGRKGGEELKETIWNTMRNYDKMKLSHLYQEVIGRCQRKVKKEALWAHLKTLQGQGKIEKIERGWYARVKDS